MARKTRGKKLVLYMNSSKLIASKKVKTFLEAWRIFSKDPEILETVKGFKISFLVNPAQEKVPQTIYVGQKQTVLIQVEIWNMMKKAATQQKDYQAGEFLSNIFWEEKEMGENSLY